MVSINYIIASFAGITRSRRGESISKDVLSIQIDTLCQILDNKKKSDIPNYIKQVTIVIPPCNKSIAYPNYYQREKWIDMFSKYDDIALVFQKYIGLNKHFSYDQWVQGMINYPQYDYHILIEDDYCIQPDNLTFDIDLVDVYLEKFPDGLGYLCSYANIHELNKDNLHPAVSNGIISNKTIQSIDDPLTYYYKIRGYPQITFGILFTDHDIPLADYRDKYLVNFWDSDKKKLIYFNLLEEENNRYIFIPVQHLYIK